MATSSGDTRAAMPRRRKQAVIVFHGMGEQRPMETLRSFVTTVWGKDPSLTRKSGSKRSRPDNPFWSKPDNRTGSYELRRLTTPRDRNGVRTDFYEMYWADIMQGTVAAHLWGWVRGLLLRSPRTVPFDVFHAWVVLWIVAAAVALLALVSAFHDANAAPWTWPGFSWLKTLAPVALLLELPRAVVVFITGALAVVTHKFLVPYFGDVARYARAEPANIEKREIALERGLALMRDIHGGAGKPQDYERVIVVAHSLGSIVAYDILTHYWAEFYQFYRLTKTGKLGKIFREMEDLYDQADEHRPMPPDFDHAKFHTLQRQLFDELKNHPERPWRISDFVTVGSPLSHAEFLVTRNERELSEKQQRRELPTCPPSPERSRNRWTITYRPGRYARFELPHHATLFAQLRWTNVFCRHWLAHLFIFPGDIISGPISRHFGLGVLDQRVWIWNWATGLFAHTSYWKWKERFDTDDPPPHIQTLRKAVNLANQREPFEAAG